MDNKEKQIKNKNKNKINHPIQNIIEQNPGLITPIFICNAACKNCLTHRCDFI